ncbi:MAG: hypothetical protein NVS3B16_23770 [Vulcanimicrobiaceae bacterium]
MIRDAAKRIFSERGIEAASMREIASAAGYSTGLIYAYFATKEELYAEILRDSLHRLYDALVESVESATSDRAVRALRRLWHFYDVDSQADFNLGFYLYGGARPAGLNHTLDNELNVRFDGVMTYIGDCLLADRLATAKDAHHLAVMHATSLFGLLLMTKTGRLKSVKEKPDRLLESYLRGVGGRNPSETRVKRK